MENNIHTKKIIRIKIDASNSKIKKVEKLRKIEEIYGISTSGYSNLK